jgi:hypothetical protein
MEVASIKTIKTPGSVLNQKGYELVSEQDIPLTAREWLRLEQLTEEMNLNYEKVDVVGDTSEDLSLNVFRVKKPGDSKIYHEEFMSLIGSQKMLSFYQKICKNPRLVIDRCQVHLYKTGDYIARHIDRESYQGYLFSLLFALSKDFSGGEMVLYNNNDSNKFKIPYRGLLFSDSGIPHEVLPIKSGIRKSLAIFLME